MQMHRFRVQRLHRYAALVFSAISAEIFSSSLPHNFPTFEFIKISFSSLEEDIDISLRVLNKYERIRILFYYYLNLNFTKQVGSINLS